MGESRGKTLPSRQAATTPKKGGNPSILNYFFPTRNLAQQLSLPPSEAGDNAMDVSQSSLDLFNNLTQETRSYPAATSFGPGDQLGVRGLSQDGASDGGLLQPISPQNILAEIDHMKEEHSKKSMGSPCPHELNCPKL